VTDGIVFNTQRFSIHDGPGIRTTLFLKGCSLRCFWCHNPESWHMESEIEVFPDLCIGCGRCVKACPHAAHEIVDGLKVFHRDRCTACGTCTKTCFAQSLVYVGARMSVDEAMAEIRKDRSDYEQSGGGVTLSGGEPLLQPAFVQQVLERCKAEAIHTAVESALHVPSESLERLLPLIDLVMMDIKMIDGEKHRRATGAHNARILANARYVAASGTPSIVRTPIIPGVNDTEEEVGAIAQFVATLPGVRSWELLPFHRLGEEKVVRLGREPSANVLVAPSNEHMQQLRVAALAGGVAVH
jgi:pyruvate formate lyase activating enzyme